MISSAADIIQAPTIPVVATPSARELPPFRFAGDHRPRVLHVINGQHFSGAERVQDLLAQRLPDEGYDVGFATLKSGHFAQSRTSTATPIYPLSMRHRFDLGVADRLAKIAGSGRYDIMHAHTPRALLVATLAARQFQLPVVYHVHSPAGRDSTRWLQDWVNQRVELWCLRRAARIIAVDVRLVDYMTSLGVDATRIDCVPNGVPSIPLCRERRYTPGGRLELAMVALFRPRKGTETLIDALALASKQRHDVRLRLVGGCETVAYQAELSAQIERLGMSDRVVWTGFARDVAAELAKVDALVLPSLFGEGLPMVVLEAMAAGVPVLASRVDGNTTAVAHGETGLLCQAGSASELASVIAAVATGQHDLSAMGLSARSRHAKLFSDVAMARGVAEVYRAVLSPSRR
jgi:glycosyltransferase involved in cell wall biosynthesis